MPGILGLVCRPSDDPFFLKKQVATARDRMRYAADYFDDPVFFDKNLVATGTRPAASSGTGGCFSFKNEIHVWLEGRAWPETAPVLAEKLAKNTENGTLPYFLKTVDGYFTAAIFDKKNGKVHLVSDRLGMKPLYVWAENGQFGWSSEVKSFLGFDGFSKKLDPRAAQCLLDLGHLIGDITWFGSVKLLPAATILTFDILKKTTSKSRYWHWSDVKTRQVRFEDAVDELGRRWQKAVESRFDPGRENIIGLSGGLDSRAILAGLSGQKGLKTYTFGEKNSLDQRIATEAARRADTPNSAFEITPENWMRGRGRGVWATDGMYSWLHLHLTPFASQIESLGGLNHNGFLGDVILGGGFLKAPGQQIDAGIARRRFGKWAELVDVADPFFDIETADPFALDTRGRRFTRCGSTDLETWVGQVKPFISNEIVEFAYSLPDHFRQKNKLYGAMLLKFYPQFYNDLPWQKTRVPLGQKTATYLVNSLKIRQLQRLFGNRSGDFVDYPRLLRMPTAAQYFQQKLAGPDALHPMVFGENRSKKLLAQHLSGRNDFSEELGRLMTIELWLRQIFADENPFIDEI